MRVLALAENLSGVHEVAAALATLPGSGTCADAHCVQSAQFLPATVHLSPAARAHDDEVVTAVNTEARCDTAQAAAERLRGILAAAPPGRTLFLKFDSLLRGHLGVQLQEARRTAPVLFCPAVPELGRTVREGVLHVGGRPLHESDLWALEPHPPAHSIAAQLGPVPVRHLDLATVRGDDLGEAAARTAPDGAVLVCDAEAPADLDRIATAGLAGGFVLAGAAGLAAALGRCLHPRLSAGPAGTAAAAEPPHPRRTGVLVALGTASAAARRQAELLESSGVPVHRLRPEQLVGFPLEHEETVAVTVDAALDPDVSAAVTAGLDESVLAVCHPVVVGDAARLRAAVRTIGLTMELRCLEDVEDAVFDGRTVNVIDLDLLPEDLPWGRLSPVAGDAAYQYIKVASEPAMAGKVQAICTAPLNKEALHAAGHLYPGHTELLAALTETEEVSMMLSTPKLRVVHVTTHIGLLDAGARIQPGLVQRTIERGHEVLVRTGIPGSRIGVAAINPHAGENGLFGYGEEAEKITPGVGAAQARGVDAVGRHPLLPGRPRRLRPGRGDVPRPGARPGEGPGIEAGVNITVGLPLIRTWVDHGTAFDIAGRNIADSRSMVEALRQAADMATR